MEEFRLIPVKNSGPKTFYNRRRSNSRVPGDAVERIEKSGTLGAGQISTNGAAPNLAAGMSVPLGNQVSEKPGEEVILGEDGGQLCRTPRQDAADLPLGQTELRHNGILGPDNFKKSSRIKRSQRWTAEQDKTLLGLYQDAVADLRKNGGDVSSAESIECWDLLKTTGFLPVTQSAQDCLSRLLSLKKSHGSRNNRRKADPGKEQDSNRSKTADVTMGSMAEKPTPPKKRKLRHSGSTCISPNRSAQEISSDSAPRVTAEKPDGSSPTQNNEQKLSSKKGGSEPDERRDDTAEEPLPPNSTSRPDGQSAETGVVQSRIEGSTAEIYDRTTDGETAQATTTAMRNGEAHPGLSLQRSEEKTSEETTNRICWIVRQIATRGKVSDRTAFRAFRSHNANWRKALESIHVSRERRKRSY
ncbi:unnamed protein product [Chondrus crispus]|uniref:Uncharacterized protein n=1 Tax=Chondrus crispus TaxID=2769 RepID=R7Q329_CHOCR|nr:unnamed protein product [Chondrus crispus]CDF32424.1 unnamed protein product [Chondrus crispus]|eukprot:XP_005712089.1 unnamed protein product [Chondrus crispus]